MALEIDGLKYPDPGADMLKHKKLGPILRSVMRTQMSQENYLFLDAVAKGESYSSLYKGFIDSAKAKHMINIPSSIRAPMEEAGKMGNFYDKKLWKDGIKSAVGSINSFVNINFTETQLMANKAFRTYHYNRMWYNRANLYKKWKLDQRMKKVKKFLGETQDPIPMEALNEAYAALKFNPKKSKEAIAKVATASGKSPRDVQSTFKKIFKIK